MRPVFRYQMLKEIFYRYGFIYLLIGYFDQGRSGIFFLNRSPS